MSNDLPTGILQLDPQISVVDMANRDQKQLIIIDSRIRWDKQAFLTQCAHSFAFPDYYGRNWDALTDCLSDVRTDATGGLMVVWRGWGGMARMYPTDYAIATSILSDFAARQADWGLGVTIYLPTPTV